MKNNTNTNTNLNSNKTYILQYIHEGNFENTFTLTFSEKQVVLHYSEIQDQLIHADIRDMYISSLQNFGQILIQGVKMEIPFSPESAFIQQSLDTGKVPSAKFIEDIGLSFICSCLFDINKMPSNVKLSYSDNPLQKNIVTITMSDDAIWTDYIEEQYSQNIEADLLKTDDDLDTLKEEAMEEMRLNFLAYEKEKQDYFKRLPFKDLSCHGPLEAYV